MRGPQSSGLIVGQKKLIEACRMNVGPNMNIGRAMKVGKEETVGLLAAVERYLSLDHSAIKEQHEAFVHTLRTELEAYGYISRRLFPAPNGQDYPQAFYPLYIHSPFSRQRGDSNQSPPFGAV